MWNRIFPLSFEQVANLSHNLATCLAAGVSLPQAFRTTTRSLAQRDAIGWEQVALDLEQGQTFADALRRVANRLPPFFLPLVDAGEKTGRLDDVLRYLSAHCRLLARPRRALRNAWLLPLAIYVSATPLKMLLFAFSHSWSGVLLQLEQAVVQLGSLAAVALILLAPPFKPAWDRLRLIIPVWGGAERDLEFSRFLRVFAMMYAAGSNRVEQMLRVAARSVTNLYLRQDLLRAARAVERHADLGHAFSCCQCVRASEQQTIAAGELSGTVEIRCERLAQELDAALETRMKMITQFTVRATMYLVTFSIAFALLAAWR